MRRGQALIVFALLMLTAMVMSMMTISLSVRAKERLELQSAADHAAWTNAVATARSMNGVSLLVRAQIAHYVAVAGVQSLVSFSGAYRGYLTAVEGYYRDEKDRQANRCSSGQPCGCTGRDELQGRLDRVLVEHQRIRGLWDALDTKTGEQIYGATLINIGLLATERESTQDLIEEQIQGARLANGIAKREATGRRWRAVPVDGINLREIGGPAGDEGAVVGRQQGHPARLWATMGTRGNPFTAARDLSNLAIEQALRRITQSSDPVVFGHTGTSYFSGQMHGNTAWTVSQLFAFADDHGVLGMRYDGGGCRARPRVFPVSGAVKSSDTTDASDFHTWSPQLPGDRENGARHTSSTCTSRECPAMFFNMEDYNTKTLADPEDLFGQPKNFAFIEDDRSKRAPDPWNLFFRFESSGIDLREKGTATAFATGMAYYHRRGHWKEPPNLFNPYWRAGLVRSDIDDQARRADLGAIAGEAFNRLYSVGYRGIP